MTRSIERITLSSVLALATLLLLSVAVLFAGVQQLQHATLQLNAITLPRLEASRAYDVNMTAAIASAQTFLIGDDQQELEQANDALVEVDGALIALQAREQSDQQSADALQPEWRALTSRRVALRDHIRGDLTSLRVSGGGDEAQRSATLDELEQDEQHLKDLDAQQQRIQSNDTSQTTSTISQLFVRLTGLLALICVVMLAALSALFVVVRRSIVRPLGQLTRAAGAIGDGNYATSIPSNGIAEIGELQRRFRQMVGLLATRDQALQHEIEVADRARAAAEEAQQHSAAQLATIVQQAAQIRDMSVPVLPMSEAVLTMPLIGALDRERLALVQQQALEHIARERAATLLLDVTGVPVIDREVAHGLLRVVQAARLLGTQVALVGIRPEVAQTIVGLGVELRDVATYATLGDGLARTIRAPGRETNSSSLPRPAARPAAGASSHSSTSCG
jgi:rsbT co-antagonist protein RsbR